MLLESFASHAVTHVQLVTDPAHQTVSLVLLH